MKTMNGICCELGAMAGPSLGAEDRGAYVYCPYADSGAILEVGKAFAYRAIISALKS